MYAAVAKLLQSCPTLCDPIDGSPLGSSIPGILQARTLEWVAISFSTCDVCGIANLPSQEAGKVVWYSHLFKNSPEFVVIHTVKGFSVFNEADVFLEY